MGENSWSLSAWLPQPWPCLLRTLLMSRLPRLPSRLPLLLLRPESTLLLHQLQLPVLTWTTALTWLLPRLPSLLSIATLMPTTRLLHSTLDTTAAPNHMPMVPTHTPLMLHTSWPHPRRRRLKHNVLEYKCGTGNWSPGHRKSIQNYTIGKGNCE